jgi:hypothetical protein
VLHDASVDVFVDGDASDSRTIRIGLRTIGIEGDRLLLSGEPFRMKAALVQGFSHERLYAEDERSRIEHEVRAAQAMGFNTLRLHAKAFDPVYLDVCDELGMLAYCDVPVTEPVDHEQLDEGTLLADRCVCAAVEQVRRDRNHPCVLVWSAMNEIGPGRADVRLSPGYERFVRLLAGAVKAADPTRPLVENDWVEPDPGRVFTTPVVTAHWYGTLHAGFLAELDSRCRASAALGRPLLVSEFGDWGLPLPPVVDDPPFRDAHEAGVAMLAASAWPGSAERFAAETHRAQGLSDRLQTEVFRRHEHVGGYCVTALTDAPHELDGLLDVDRRPKPEAVREMTLANSSVLPLLELPALVFWAGEPVHAVLHVANDGPALQGCTAEIFFRGDRARLTMEELLVLDTSGLTVEEAYRRLQVSVVGRRIDVLEADRPTRVGDVVVDAPLVPGGHELVVLLREAKGIVAENRYPVHVVVRPGALPGVRLLGTGPTADALREVGVFGDPTGPTVVGEGALEPEMRPELEHVLAGAGTVLVLAQPPTAAACYPAPVRLSQSERHAPGFRFTTGHPALPSLPRCSLLAAEDSSLEAGAIVSAVGGLPFPATPLVIAYAPAPPPLTGCIVGEHRVGSGRLLFCQYGLCEPALRLDAAAQALLADLVAWAAAPLEPVQAEVRVREDGRVVRLYLEQRP